MTSLEQHPLRPWPALPACLCVPVRHATARCPDQTIVAVLVRLAFFHAIPTTYVNGSTLGTAQRRTDYCVSAAAHNSVEPERGGGIKLPATSSLSVLGQGPARQSAQHRGCVPRQQSPTSCISPGRALTRRERAVEGQSCSGEWLAPRSFDFSEPSLSLPRQQPACQHVAAAAAAAAGSKQHAGIDKDAVAALTLVSY